MSLVLLRYYSKQVQNPYSFIKKCMPSEAVLVYLFGVSIKLCLMDKLQTPQFILNCFVRRATKLLSNLKDKIQAHPSMSTWDTCLYLVSRNQRSFSRPKADWTFVYLSTRQVCSSNRLFTFCISRVVCLQSQHGSTGKLNNLTYWKFNKTPVSMKYT